MLNENKDPSSNINILDTIKKVFKIQEIGVIAILFLMGVFLSFMTENFLTSINIFNVLRQFSWIAISGFGAIFVIIAGGIDLSVGSTMALAGLTTAICLRANVNLWVSIFAGIGSGVAVGLLNGILISKAKLPAFIATIGTMSVARGLCYGLTNGLTIQNLPESFVFYGRSNVSLFGLNIPLPVIIMFALAILTSIFLFKTVWGYWIFAHGGNEQATLLSGVNTSSVKILVYTLSGLMSALGGILMTSRLGAATPIAASGYELDVVAAIFIGGASTSGGEGSILGVIIGAAIMQVLRNGLVLLGFPAYWQSAAIGVVIIIALSLDQYRKQHQH